MQLPFEILDLIFELIADDPLGPDIETMKACNLASSSISAICERHLYSSICFCIHSASSQVSDSTYYQLDPYYARSQISARKFAFIQINKPHVNGYVRRLGIIVHDEKSWEMKRSWWRTIKEVLLQLHLDKIQALKLQTNSTVLQQIDPSVIEGPITKILKSPVLNTLYADNILNFPSRQLHGHASGLRALEIGYITEDEEGPIASTFSTFPPPPKLDSLTLRQGSKQKIITLPSDAMKLNEYPYFDLVSLSTFSMTMSTGNKAKDVALGRFIIDRTSNLKVLTLQSRSCHMFHVKIIADAKIFL